MSQYLTPIDGGVSQVGTPETRIQTTKILSPKYLEINKLGERPTAWTSNGRPIYDRLPSVSQKYRIDFEADGEIGYVYIPYGEGINGSNSLEVVVSPSRQDLLIKGGKISWKYGLTEFLPTIVNMPTLNIESGKYLVAYQMVFDDTPKDFQYSVEDYFLTGLPLTVTSNTDSVVGWRFPAKNAFLDGSLRWSATDRVFPDISFASPYLSWVSQKPYAFSKIQLWCPANSAFVGTASLTYGNNTLPAQTVSVLTRNGRQVYEFSLESPSFQTTWTVTWSDSTASINEIRVSGVLTMEEKQYAPSTRGTLVMYPENRVPKDYTYCDLAYVDVNDQFFIEDIRDVRNIIHQPYIPVADWLTYPFDRNLTEMKTQVENYSTLWMSPEFCMNQEYAGLEEDGVQVT